MVAEPHREVTWPVLALRVLRPCSKQRHEIEAYAGASRVSATVTLLQDDLRVARRLGVKRLSIDRRLSASMARTLLMATCESTCRSAKSFTVTPSGSDQHQIGVIAQVAQIMRSCTDPRWVPAGRLRPPRHAIAHRNEVGGYKRSHRRRMDFTSSSVRCGGVELRRVPATLCVTNAADRMNS